MFLFNFFLPKTNTNVPVSIYEFRMPGITGETIDFSAYKGKKIMIVNTASRCGFTGQYEGLEALYQKYQGKLAIVGFPANNFMFQEPGSNESIAAFCSAKYQVSFPMGAKLSVKGRDMDPLYQWLTEKKYNGLSDNKVKWNFQKYLISEAGKLVAVFPPTTEPTSEAVIAAINKTY